jgi:hypothetical protein
MLRSIQDMFGCSVVCPDGDMGKVGQIYFDVHRWYARYLVIDTSAWGYGQKIWVPPCCIHQIDFDSSVVKLNLDQQKMLGSPAIDTLKPISRLQEARLVNYFGCKPYWEEAHAPVASQYPSGAIRSAAFTESERRERMTLHTNAVNSKVHLLSTRQAGGYTIEAVDGPIMSYQSVNPNTGKHSPVKSFEHMSTVRQLQHPTSAGSHGADLLPELEEHVLHACR